MRRYFFAATLLAIAAAMPLHAFGDDNAIAKQIIKRLSVQRDAGTLKGFTLDLKVKKGVVVLRGNVSNDAQKTAVLAAASDLEGVEQVIDEVAIQQAATAADSRYP
ncbi:MAG: BON domain-containing protein, partial [Planctomycetota bacterium]